MKNQGIGPDNSQQGQAVACMGEKQSNSSWGVNTVTHFKRDGQSIQGYDRCARLVRLNNLKLMTGLSIVRLQDPTASFFQIQQSIFVTQES